MNSFCSNTNAQPKGLVSYRYRWLVAHLTLLSMPLTLDPHAIYAPVQEAGPGGVNIFWSMYHELSTLNTSSDLNLGKTV